MEEEMSYGAEINTSLNIKFREIEDKQRIMRDRILLVGQNLIDTREDTKNNLLMIKKELENLKQDIQRMKSFMENVSTEISKFAKKEDLTILAKQAKMFQPLEFVRVSEIESMIKKEMEKNGNNR